MERMNVTSLPAKAQRKDMVHSHLVYIAHFYVRLTKNKNS